MNQAIVAIFSLLIAALSVLATMLFIRWWDTEARLRLLRKDYDGLMQRAVKAETDFQYLKDTVGAVLSRPMGVALRDDQIGMIARSIAQCAMQGSTTTPTPTN